jgi:multimeric flavodoxin WrbA
VSKEARLPSPEIRKGMPSPELSREAFEQRFKARFFDPAFAPLSREIQALADVAWNAYSEGRKAPRTRKAGPGFADPDYDLSVEWLAGRDAIAAAQRRHDDPAEPSRILLINGSARSEHTCPGEMSKTWRLIQLAQQTIAAASFVTDILDLSRTQSEFGKTIHPCKSCVSTSMTLCHWPCSCYPNHALGQVHDWMNDIYPLWVAAHGVMIVTPVNWYQAPGPLKLMMDRLVCADGGNPDPTSTHGKHPDEAKALELTGWPYPRHLADRLFAAVVHGDAAGAEVLRDQLIDWAQDMHLIPAGANAELGRYVGYYEPYATSHEALDRDEAFQTEVRNAAFTLMEAVTAKREGRLVTAGTNLKEPRPK